MLSRAEIYKNNAAECEREALRATTPVLKSKYQGVAQQWHEMAEQATHSAVGEPGRFETSLRKPSLHASRKTGGRACPTIPTLSAATWSKPYGPRHAFAMN